jgi:hypothetical protein
MAIFNGSNTFEATKVTTNLKNNKFVDVEVKGMSFKMCRRIQDGSVGDRSMSHTVIWLDKYTPWKVWWWDEKLKKS